MTSMKLKGLIDTTPNYHAGWEPEWDVCAESCCLAQNSVQGLFSAKVSHLCPGTLSRQRQTEAESPPIHTDLRKPPSHGEIGDCYLNSKVPQHRKTSEGMIGT